MVALNYGALVLAVLLATAGASRTASAEGRVAVTVRTEKAAFLAGEPVIVLVDVRNAGTEPVTYSSGVGTIQLSVPGGAEKPVRRLTSCCMFEGVVNGTGGSTHPPVLRPGEAVTLRHLLRGYRLGPGSYKLVVSGKADVGWPAAEWGTVATRQPLDPVEGQLIDHAVPLTIVPGTTRQLEAAFAPYLAAAYARDARTHLAQQALFESAAPLLERRIAALADDFRTEPFIVTGAVRALGEINTRGSRTRLRSLFDSHQDASVRSAIVQALAQTYHSDTLPFFISVRNGSRGTDDRTRRYAALGLGRIGTDAAVRALRDAPMDADRLVTGAVLEALGNTQQRSAIPVLIARARGPDGHVIGQVCCALSELTHHAWCDGSGNVVAMQARWRRWWAANGATVGLYGPDECPPSIGRLPELPGVR